MVAVLEDAVIDGYSNFTYCHPVRFAIRKITVKFTGHCVEGIMVVNLEQQIQKLIDQAPADLQQPIAHISPVLNQIAEDLAHQSYFIGQNTSQEWIVITLQNGQKVQMDAVYAFGHQQDAVKFYGPTELAIKMPVIDLLFQLLALASIHQLIFFDEVGNMESGRTLSRSDLQQSIEQHLQNGNTLPPDVC